MNTEGPGWESDAHWNSAPLRLLIAQLASSYHGYLKKELHSLNASLADLAARSPADQPLARLSGAIHQIDRRLELLMYKEESTLFRAILALEGPMRDHDEEATPAYGSVANLVGALSRENRLAAAAVEEIAGLLEIFVTTYGENPELFALSGRLALLRKNLQRHLYLALSILYPRAIEMEKNRTSQ